MACGKGLCLIAEIIILLFEVENVQSSEREYFSMWRISKVPIQEFFSGRQVL